MIERANWRFLFGLQLFALSGVGLFALGCGVGEKAATPDSVISSMSGIVHGGQSPVVGASIQMYSVGLPSTGGGYGSGSAALLSTPATTQAGGAFNITTGYTCPSGGYAYIVATGGNSGSTYNNSALALMAALGPCSGISSSTQVNISEATTVAAIWSLQQFASATFGTANTLTIGAPSTNAQGLKNAFGAAGNLMNVANPNIPSSIAVGTVTVSSEAYNVGTLANILASCINSGDSAASGGTISSNCSTLFTDATPSGSTKAADTLQAALYMAKNPTNVGTSSTGLFSLSSAVSPYPGLSSPPNDFTLALGYQTTSLTPPVYGLAVDATGNVWAINSGNTGVSEISPAGALGATVLSTYLQSPRGIAIDTAGNIWVTNSSASSASATNTLLEYLPSTPSTPKTYGITGGALYGIAIDASNDIFATDVGTSSLVELASGASTITTIGTGSLGTSSYGIAIDPSADIWVSGISANSGDAIAEFTCGSGCSTSSTPSTFNTGEATPIGLAIDKNGNVWAANNGANRITKVLGASPNTATNSPEYLGGAYSPEFISLDGSGDVWFTNQKVETDGTFSISELGPLSTSTSLSGNGGSTPSSGVGGFQHSLFSEPRGIAIDGSGNVWVSNQNTANSTVGIVEIVGAATPAVTPLATALSTSKLGQTP